MTHRILLFAGVRAASGLDHIELDIQDGDTAKTVLEKLAERLPESAGLIRISRLASNGAYVNDGDSVGGRRGELALIPPVSGG
ncbi:MAG: MoaD/ThiS family protein [Planctomycetota bacterium]